MLECKKLIFEFQTLSFSFKTLFLQIQTEKERNVTQSFYKSPYTHKKIQNCNVTIHKCHQKLRLHNDNHKTGVVKPVNGITTFPLSTRKVVQLKTKSDLCNHTLIFEFQNVICEFLTLIFEGARFFFLSYCPNLIEFV